MTGEEQQDKRKSAMVIFRDMTQGLMRLKPESRHRIVDAMLDWFCDNETKALEDPAEEMIVTMLKARQMAYEQTCLKRREAAAKGGRAKRLLAFAEAKPASTSTSTSTSASASASTSTATSSSASDGNGHRAVSVRPTIEEVKAYCQERGNRVDVQAWYDHYVSNGWRVGKNPMRDWKAAVRTWERNEIKGTGGCGQHPVNWRGTRPEDLDHVLG